MMTLFTITFTREPNDEGDAPLLKWQINLPNGATYRHAIAHFHYEQLENDEYLGNTVEIQDVTWEGE